MRPARPSAPSCRSAASPRWRRERLDIPCVIGGEEVRTGDTRRGGDAAPQGARPRRRAPGRRGRGRARDQGVRRGVARLVAGRPGRSAPPCFLRAAELLAGPWRTTLIAATMLNQSKTAHQAEIDAASELIDFFRFNVEFMTRDLRGAAGLLTRASGTAWSTGRSRASSSPSARSTSRRSAAT